MAYGAPNKQGTAGSHGAPLGEDEIKLAKNAMKWNYEPFYIPEEVLKLWREAGIRNKQNYQSGLKLKKIKLKSLLFKKNDFNERVKRLQEKKALNIF